MTKMLLLICLLVVAFGSPGTAMAQFSEVMPSDLNLVLAAGESVVEQVSLTILPACVRPIDVDVVASDPDPVVSNLTGVLANQCGGDTTTFDIRFTGDGTARTFDLQFVDAESGGVIDSIPVTLSTSSCPLDLTLTLNRTTLEMDFEVGTTVPATWNVWISIQTLRPFRLWSSVLPPIDPPIAIPVPLPGFPQLGSIGILTTLTTPGEGIICSDWETVDTGTPASAPSARELRELFRRHVPGR